MSHKHDYIPTNDASFDSWFFNLLKYVEGKTNPPPVWDHIPSRYVLALDAALNDWRASYTPTLQPHVPALTTAKNEARKLAEKVIRPFVQRFLYYEPVTDADRVNMSLPLHDTTRTEGRLPSTVPEIEADSSVIRRIRLRMRDFGAKTWSKPDGVHGMELRWAILTARPGHIDELIHPVNATSNPIDLNYEEDDRSKRVFFAARWVNGTEQGGPWSDIESAVIP